MPVRAVVLASLVALLAVASVGCSSGDDEPAALTGTTETTTTETEPTGGSVSGADDELECEADDLVFLQHVDRDEPQAGEDVPASPEAAVAAQIAQLNPHLNPGMFQREAARGGGSGSDQVSFAHKRGGKKLAEVKVGRHGPGWAVTEIQACNSLLR